VYEIILQSKAEKFLKKLDKTNQQRVINKLKCLKENPKLGVPLTANLAGLWKLRIGDYRAIYQILNQELTILILKIGKRDNVYD